jgi:hypothetical protein
MDSAREAGVFHHLLPYLRITTALHMNDLAKVILEKKVC